MDAEKCKEIVIKADLKKAMGSELFGNNRQKIYNAWSCNYGKNEVFFKQKNIPPPPENVYFFKNFYNKLNLKYSDFI